MNRSTQNLSVSPQSSSLEQSIGAHLSSRDHISEGLSGALAGACVTALLYPIDTVKVLLQTHTARSLPSIVLSTVSKHGLKILYAGASTSLITSACFSGVYTSTFESARALLAPLLCSDHQWLAQCAAGGLASVATSFIYTPSEVIRSRLQVVQYSSWGHAAGDILRRQGPKGLYCGWSAVLCRNVPQSCIKFLVFEQLRSRCLAQRGTFATPETLVCGGLAGAAAASFTTPFDVVKTRLQVTGQSQAVFLLMKQISQSEGVMGLFRGLGPRLVIYMMQGAIFFAAYELLKGTRALSWRRKECRLAAASRKLVVLPFKLEADL